MEKRQGRTVYGKQENYNDHSYFIGNPTLSAFTWHKSGLDINWKQHTLSLEYNRAKDMITNQIVQADEKAMYEQYGNPGKYHEWDISYNYTGNPFS